MNLAKALQAAVRPAYWPALARGVVPTLDHRDAFAGLDFATVVDVGANKGQFSLFAARRWPRARIVAFEPQPDQAALYRAVMGSRADLRECALAAAPGEMPLHIASRRDSSSLLPLGELQKSMFGMDEVRTIAVPIRTLDDEFAVPLPRPALLKIDVQGYEYEVLAGGRRALDGFDHVYVEASYVELYQDQKLFADVDGQLIAAGFTLAARHNVMRDGDGREVQADLLYARDR